MKEKVFTVVLNIMLFWVVSDLFSGIDVLEGVVGYLVCGGIFGIGMLAVIPLIRFFTLPVKFITVLLIAMMLSVMIFFLLNLGVSFVDFKDGVIEGFTNRYFSLGEVPLGMMGNVMVGGLVCGILSAILEWLQEGVPKRSHD